MSIPFNFTTYTDREAQDVERIPLGAGTELTNIAEEAFREGSLLTPALNTIQEQLANIDSEQLTTEQANEEYGLPGELEFKEPISRGAAKLRFEKHERYLYNKRIHDIADNDNDWLDNTRNTIAFMGAAMLLDPTTYLFSPTKAVGLLANATKGIKALSEVPLATKFLSFVEREAINPTLFKGPITTGIVRGLVDEGITQGITEAALYDQAQKYGYDYDVLLGVASVLLGGAVRGAGEAVEGLSAARKGSVIDHLFQIDNYTQTKVLSKQTFNNLVTRVVDDVSAGKITDHAVIKAAMKLDTEAKLTKAFQRDLYQGLETVISRGEIEALTRQDLISVKPLTNMYRILQNEGLFTSGIRHIDDIPTPSKFEGVKINSLEKVSKLINENDELLKKYGKQKSQLGEALRAQDEYLKAVQNQLTKDRITRLYRQAEQQGFPNGKKPNEMTLPELEDTYKTLRDKIKSKRTKMEFKTLFKKKTGTRLDIANLHRLVDPEISHFELEDLLTLSPEDLKAVHAKHKYYDEAINNISEKEAREAIAQYAKDPREVAHLEYLEAEQRFEQIRLKAEAEVKEIEAGAKARVDKALRPKEEGVKVEGEVSNDPVGDRYQIPKDIRELAEYKQVDDFFGQQKKHIKGLMEGVTCLLGN